MRPVTDRTPSPDVIVSGFHNLEPIGQGGFSRVFRATQTGLERPVALKVLNGTLDTKSKANAFERECRAMGALSTHPNIVTVFSAASSSEGRPCIVMELYENGTFGERVKLHGPIGLVDVVDIGQRLCDALTAAHAAGIIHRDIKPQNMYHSDYATVVLGDFGISSFEEDRTVTSSGTGLTVHYAPPELLEGCKATPQSDIYSLAASLYFLVSGERPFPKGPDETIVDVARRILVHPAPVFDPDGPGRNLGLVLANAMSKNPDDRPHSAAALRSALVDSVSVASPKAKPQRSSREKRSALIGVVALVTAALLTFFTVGRDDTSNAEATLSSSAAVDDDTFFGAPEIPRNVVIGGTTRGFEVSWDLVPGVSEYAVVRIDADDKMLVVTGSPAVITTEPGERPCVVVRAVGDNGLMSLDSDAVCA